MTEALRPTGIVVSTADDALFGVVVATVVISDRGYRIAIVT